MKVQTTNESPQNIKADAIVIGIWEGEPLSGAAAWINEACGGVLSRMIEIEEISSKRFTPTPLLGLKGIVAPVVMVVGLGPRSDMQADLARKAAGAGAKALATKQRKRVAFYVDVPPVDQAVSGSLIGCVGQDLYQTESALHPFQTILWASRDGAAVRRGELMGANANLTRRLVNMPANEIYPESFAAECVRVGEEIGIDVEVWDQKRLAKENCRALLAVAQGSDRPPRLVILRYRGGPKRQKPLGLVGKGVTFDSGGLSLKPSESMLEMKSDMTGAATVLGAMRAVAQMELPYNVFGFAGLAENMISGASFKLGDVYSARNGKTIEIHNTDAEGRLVLADTLNVAVESGVERIVDLATLTGACMVALGRDTAGVMTNHRQWCDTVMAACNSVGEPVWELPMFPEYGEHIKSKVADIKNMGDGRWGGAITAAKFLEEFVDGTPWVHIDIAGPSFLEKPKPWLDAGASGCYVNALVQLVINLSGRS
jgi:leucyl aminopeptidase